MKQTLHLNDMRIALSLLKEEMRAMGWWQNYAPSAEALASTEPFCVDTLSFSEWLQWVYTPKMHAFINQTGKLPDNSGLTPIAEEAWKNSPQDIHYLQQIVHLLDAIIQGEYQDLLASITKNSKQ